MYSKRTVCAQESLTGVYAGDGSSVRQSEPMLREGVEE